ncbi:pumilio domain member 4 [Phytophthora pseudosyringae]|uniref:Pumilio domain member 4 n=1 Tax=Phytophthora pseudosyringae TaxID=221518 RepID=A0A8T1VDV7_9STRA|nr:pumilio domain member 4 [Phytophthora pseudosyringae]
MGLSPCGGPHKSRTPAKSDGWRASYLASGGSSHNDIYIHSAGRKLPPPKGTCKGTDSRTPPNGTCYATDFGPGLPPTQKAPTSLFSQRSSQATCLRVCAVAYSGGSWLHVRSTFARKSPQRTSEAINQTLHREKKGLDQGEAENYAPRWMERGGRGKEETTETLVPSVQRACNGPSRDRWTPASLPPFQPQRGTQTDSALLRRIFGRRRDAHGEWMTMEFAPPSGPSAGPGKLSYGSPQTDKDSGGDGQQAATGLSFESSSLFRFGSSSDFFAPMKYSEDERTASASSPTGSAGQNSSSDAGSKGVANAGNNNDALPPPRALSPSNQTTHDREDASAAPETTTQGPGERPIDIKVRKARPPVEMLPSHNSRRKNSIEMFLSQSPSQALGGDFLKLSLDDRQMSLQTNERAPNGGNGVSGSAGVAASASSYATGQFQLNSVQESPNEYGSLAGRYRHQQPSPAAQQQQERYRSGGRDTQQPHMPTSLSLSRSSTVPGTSSAPTSAGYSGAYTLSPRMSSEESWSGSQDGDNNALYQEQMHDYYGNNQVPASYALEQQQYRQQQQQQQQQQQYRSPQTANGSYGYGNTPSRVQMTSGQWNPMVVGPHPPTGMYDGGGNNMYMNPRSSPMRHPHAQMGYASHQQVAMGMRGGGHTNSRAQGRNMYSRMTPPLPESSPPHSPRKGMGMGLPMGMKQCKFFLQGHCRMGSKCKFVHQTGAPTPEHMGGGHSSNRQNASMMYQQSRMMMSPPPSHMMQQQRHQMSGDDLSHQLNGGFGGRQQSRMGYRSENSGASGMGLGLMNGGGMSAPIMGGSANDPSSLSAALSVEDIQNRVFAMSKDQNGCRLLQEQLDYEDRADLCEVIYQESLDHLAEMMVDPFGNYLFQKLLERVNEKQRLVIIRRVSSNLVAAALNLHGTRSVQKVVEVCATSPDVIEEDYDEEDGDDYGYVNDREEHPDGGERRRTTSLPDIIVEALKDDAVRLCIDSNGNHVIQRALQFMKPEYNQFVFDAVCKECTTVGTHRHGCCVLQRCLDAANKAQKAEVIEQVERQAMKLMQDPYGNYVVQYVLDSCTAEEAFGVIMKPLGHIYELSVQKFSSNVIEKCLEKAPERVRQKYIAEITSCPKMNKMLQDQFANYVVQRALCVCAEEQCLLLVKAIRPHLAAMKNTSGGRRITARILKRFPNMDISMDMGMSPTADNLFDNGANSMMMGHLTASTMGGGGYMHQQHLQPNQQMYGMQGGHMGASRHFQGGGRGDRMQQMHGNDGSIMMLNDVGGMGMNATSRA